METNLNRTVAVAIANMLLSKHRKPDNSAVLEVQQPPQSSNVESPNGSCVMSSAVDVGTITTQARVTQSTHIQKPQVKRTDYDSRDFFQALFSKSPFRSDILVSQDGNNLVEHGKTKLSDLKIENGKVFVKRKNENEWDKVLEIDGYIDERRLKAISPSITESKIYLLDPTGDKIQLVEINRGDLSERKVIASDDTFDVIDVLYHPISREPEAVKVNGDYAEWKAVKPNSLMNDHLNFLESQGLGKADILSVDDNFETWAVCLSDSDKPPSYYIYKPKLGELTLVKKDNKELEEFELAKTIPFIFTARDGLPIHAFLTLPPNKKPENLPLIINVHGGPESSEDASWRGPDAQWSACRLGCAEVKVNFRGSSGRGRKFEELGHGQWGLQMQDDLADLVNFLKSVELNDKKLINPDKITISGFSYGGYAALNSAAKSKDLFCCAVATEPPTDLTTGFDGPGGIYTNREKVILGDPIQDNERLQRTSPAYYIDKMEIPVYIQWGMGPNSLGKSHAKPFIDGLEIKSSGVKDEIHHANNFTIRLFSSENHVISSIENNQVLRKDIEEFLRRYLIN